MAAVGIVLGIFLVMTTIPGKLAQITDCPPPFPTKIGTVTGGRCECNRRTVGLSYSCNGIKRWPQITESDAREVESLQVVLSDFPSSRLPSYFLASYAPRIVDFTCASCGLVALEAFAFANVSTLKRIKLDGNPLRVLGALAFANLQGLNEISLRETSGTSVAADSFFNLSNVRYIFLSKNPGMVIEAGAFRNASGIEQLDFTDHGMRRLNGSFLAGLSGVRHLVLSSAHGIDEVGAGALDGLRDVTNVYLTSSALQRVLPGAFAGAVRIGTVLLNQNTIRTVENGTLAGGDVATVDWTGNPIECDERLAWIFEPGGLGDGLRAPLLHQMRCQQPIELHHSLVAELRGEYEQRGYLGRRTTAAADRNSVGTEAPARPTASTTASSLKLQLQRYVALMNSTKNRRRNSGPRPAAGDGLVVALGLGLAATAAVIFS